MTAATLLAAEKRHAQALGVPGKVTIDNAVYDCRLIAGRGLRIEMDGGASQERQLTCVILADRIKQSELIEASTGKTRTRSIVHDGISYTIAADGVNISPAGGYYRIRATQPLVR